MMAGNPNWWSMDTSSTISDIHHHQEVTPNFLISQTHPNNNNNNNNNSVFPVQYLHGSLAHHSWSQLLLGGLGNDHQEEEIFGPSLFQSTRVMSSSVVDDHDHVKQEVYGYNHSFNHDDHDDHDHDEEQETRLTAWSQSHTTMPTSSPKSCVTTLSSPNNILDFSATKRSLHDHDTHLYLENSNSECNSTPTKKPRVQSSSNPPLKVRKEKLGDRITALHQLVSPFGKTDTASVLLEAIGYIRILQVEIQALSTPYLGSNSGSAKLLQSVQGERSYLFPDHPGQEKQDVARELKSRGLCLVPISCTQLVGSDNGADYWAPSLGGGF